MATPPWPNAFSLAPQKLAQLINPLYWLTSGTGQIGFVNISGQASAKPEVEADIIENVATYGRQLGRITDVLNAILKDVAAHNWTGEAAKAVEQFNQMNAQIAAVKAGHLAPTQQNLDKLIAGIRSLKDSEPAEYVRIKDELRKKLFVDDGDVASLEKARGNGGRKR